MPEVKAVLHDEVVMFVENRQTQDVNGVVVNGEDALKDHDVLLKQTSTNKFDVPSQ